MAKVDRSSCGKAKRRKHMMSMGPSDCLSGADFGGIAFSYEKAQRLELIIIHSIGVASKNKGRLEIVQYRKKPTFLRLG